MLLYTQLVDQLHQSEGGPQNGTYEQGCGGGGWRDGAGPSCASVKTTTRHLGFTQTAEVGTQVGFYQKPDESLVTDHFIKQTRNQEVNALKSFSLFWNVEL